MAGATPLVIDVQRDTWIPEAGALDDALRRTGAAAAMLVNPFGLKRNFRPLIDVCRRHGAFALVDNAAGFGIAREGVETARDVMEVYSMHATKPFAIGEGGIIFAHADHDQSLRSAINFALHSYTRPEGPTWGVNGKLSEFHSAIGLAQLVQFPSQLERRRRFVARYFEHLGTIRGLAYPTDMLLSPWQYLPLVLADPQAVERFVKYSEDKGMEIRRYYRPSLSLWPGVECAHPCANSEWLSEHACCLPVYGDASTGEQDEMLDVAISSLQRALST